MNDSTPNAEPFADSFVHLRVHTAYSLSEGAVRTKELTGLCRELGMPAVAMTDTNNMFGAVEFSNACSGAGIQPILGAQLAVDISAVAAAERDQRPSARMAAPRPDTVVLLAQNEAGNNNAKKLLSRAFLNDDDAQDPQVTLEELVQANEGLILLTGGAGGPVGRLLAQGRDADAEAVLLRLAAAFAGRLYIEIGRHGLEVEDRIEPRLIEFAHRHNLPLVATNEVFFTTEEMYEAHDALICIAEGAYLSQTERRRLTPEHRFKTAREMRELFADLPEAVNNTLVIAKRCAFMLEFVAPILPPYDCGAGRTEEDELRHMAEDGLELRLTHEVLHDGMSADAREQAIKTYKERLAFELGVINQMGFPGYFLIVADFIQWAKNQGIPVGPGRGSGAGSVVAWALTITDLDPLRFGLLFERFLNPERVSMPDFDIDFCQDRREEVIRYVQDKYGYDHVAQIITFGKLQARAVLRDVGRVLEMPYGQVDRICKLVPNDPGNAMDLRQAVASEPQLREMIAAEETVARLIQVGQKLEGLFRHASTHAAGVVIGDRPLDELVPLYRDPRSDMPVTQFNMKHVETQGLVKFDFLGLKTLTVLQKAVQLLAVRDITVDLATIPLDDPKTFVMLGRGDATGVFQLESAGMRDVLRNMKPDTFEDLIAVVALYRPGPMDNIPSYIRRKHGEEAPDYLYPTLEPILKETYGIMIYQEQVMQIAQELSGYSLGGADILRRAMGKKDQAVMDKQIKVFVDGASARGVPAGKAKEIFDLVLKFANYGFNKSHAAAYALVAYQTAYLKANHPVEFIAASMTLDINNTDKLNVFRQELDRSGIKLLAPDINKSLVEFWVEQIPIVPKAEDDPEPMRDTDGLAVRYALAGIKNVGEGAMEAVVAERDANGPFTDVMDFANRLDTKSINKRQLENLVSAGAFDKLEPNRHRMHKGVETLLRHAAVAASERSSNQIGLFGAEEATSATAAKLPDLPDWPLMERLAFEFNAIGFYFSAHPLDAYGKSLQRMEVKSLSEIMRRGQSGGVNMAGTIISKKERTSAKGNRFAFVQLSDATGMFEITLFSEQLSASRDLLEAGTSVLLRATAEFSGETLRLTAHSVEDLDAVAARTAAGMKIYLEDGSPLPILKEILANEKKGKGQVKLVARLSATREAEIELPTRYTISPLLLQAVKAVPGIGNIEEI